MISRYVTSFYNRTWQTLKERKLDEILLQNIVRKLSTRCWLSFLTQAAVLSAHQRNLCASATFIRVILNEHFYIPRAQMTIKTIINSYRCSICLLARCPTKKIEPPTGNIQNFRVPNKVGDEKNRPYKVIYYDFKGPIRVNDDRKIKRKKEKISD